MGQEDVIRDIYLLGDINHMKLSRWILQDGIKSSEMFFVGLYQGRCCPENNYFCNFIIVLLL